MTVVVGYVPNEYGEVALEAGLVEARRRGQPLVVINASRGDTLVDRKYLSTDARADLERRLADEGARVGVETEVRQALVPDVAEEVVRVAHEVEASLLVIGMRRRTPVGKMLLGSAAQRILLDAACPVLAVKPPEPA